MPGALDQTRVFFPRLRRIITRPEVGLGLLLAALTIAVYGRAVAFGFVVFDDPRYVTENFHVLRGLNLGGIRWAFSTFHDANWIPLTRLSLMLDATLYGRWAGGFHATNILLHVANVLLVFLCITRATGETLRSAFVAALFAIHPLHVESVAWIAERKDVLSVFFGLLCLGAYVRYARSQRYTWLLTALVCLGCSLASKQTFVTLPFVFLLLDYWPLGRFTAASEGVRGNSGPSNRRRRVISLVLEKIPFLILSAAFCAMAFWAQSKGHSVRPFAEMSLSTRVLNAILAYGSYLEKALWPFGLAIFYPHPGTAINLTRVAFSGLVLGALTAFAIATRRRWPFVLVGWLWFLGTLVPMLGLVQVGLQRMADRYAYLPNLGLYLMLAWLAPSVVPLPVARTRIYRQSAASLSLSTPRSRSCRSVTGETEWC